MNRLQDLEVFVQVVKSGNFAKAAAELQLNPSAISRRISHLEDHLGVRLFHRTTRSLNLTEVGDRYLNRCLSILAELEEAEREAKQHSKASQGTLHFPSCPLRGNRKRATGNRKKLVPRSLE